MTGKEKLSASGRWILLRLVMAFYLLPFPLLSEPLKRMIRDLSDKDILFRKVNTGVRWEDVSKTFYIGNDLDDLSTTKVSLPQNEKIHGFSLTDDTLFVSVAAKTSEEDQQNPYIESFDLETGKSIKKRSLSAPLYSITTNDSDQLCGFSVSIFKMYSIKEPLEEIRLGDTLIHGEFYKIFPDKDSFLIVIYGFDDPPEFWKVIAK